MYSGVSHTYRDIFPFNHKPIYNVKEQRSLQHVRRTREEMRAKKRKFKSELVVAITKQLIVDPNGIEPASYAG